MPVKRRASKGTNRVRPFSEETRLKAARLLQLYDNHAEAIRTGKGTFYEDGRHEEMVDLGTEVFLHRLGVNPIFVFDRQEEILEAVIRGERPEV